MTPATNDRERATLGTRHFARTDLIGKPKPESREKLDPKPESPSLRGRPFAAAGSSARMGEGKSGRTLSAVRRNGLGPVGRIKGLARKGVNKHFQRTGEERGAWAEINPNSFCSSRTS